MHDKLIDRHTFEQQQSRLDEDETRLKDQLLSESTAHVDLAGTLEFAEFILTDLAGCWNRLDWQRKPAFVAALHPDGLTFDNAAIGTDRNSWLVTNSDSPFAVGSRLAVPTGFEPVFPP